MNNKGFTLIEMVIVLSILSIIVLITIYISINSVDKFGLTSGINDFETKLEYLETKSLSTKQPILVWFKPNSTKIQYQINNGNIHSINLYKGKISKDNKFTTLVYDGEGNINQFGTLKLEFNNKRYLVIFRIEKGRYRIVEEK
ncbi:MULTISPECIES: competence type IV pilus minor pilin ComGD [Mammaliicoccus]|uniref:Type II secretion system GspH family protein n=1 Tax=Mammaliicoccus lentus TaxID=42858 RepID=A0ABS6GUX9_MAMLE|nr:competence type IV pilus minor pilin ComGD [Mammaliicoccus lentus]MBF0842288.1 type II secretion system protein [Mammaliicoccus lentus]MBU6113262.1 type II secretion system GspH family protein [Mammaliicoccus lentus]